MKRHPHMYMCTLHYRTGDMDMDIDMGTWHWPLHTSSSAPDIAHPE